MGETVNVKKSTVIIGVCVLVIGLFVFFAMRNVFGSSDSINGELVQGGEVGSNKIINEGDAQVVNLGAANYNYDPETITVEAGKKVKIVGNMQQLRGCLRAFTVPSLGISKVFKDRDNILEFIPSAKGSYGFSCSMGMGAGTLIIK